MLEGGKDGHYNELIIQDPSFDMNRSKGSSHSCSRTSANKTVYFTQRHHPPYSRRKNCSEALSSILSFVGDTSVERDWQRMAYWRKYGERLKTLVFAAKKVQGVK
jgi:hypothetical protein